MRRLIRTRRATGEDIASNAESIAEWLNWRIPGEQSIKRAIKSKELLVAERKGAVIDLINYVQHKDIIDGGLKFFITCFYVALECRGKGVGSMILTEDRSKGLIEGDW